MYFSRCTGGGKTSQPNQERDQNASNHGQEKGQGRGCGRIVQCYFCGKNGHIASTCYNLKNLLFGTSPSQEMETLITFGS